jgi:hypothetical protein
MNNTTIFNHIYKLTGLFVGFECFKMSNPNEVKFANASVLFHTLFIS